MKKLISILIFIFLISSKFTFSSLSTHITWYDIKAKLIPEEKALKGEEVLTWLNSSDQFISELHFHLYLNAFKNNLSTFMREGKGRHRNFKIDSENWGYIEIKKIQLENGEDLSKSIKFIHPDDNNEYDRTVMKINLPKPVPPNGKITLYIEFYSKLPRVFARTGYYRNFFMVAQWFPKIGVLKDGKWNCHQYHLNSEFFADYGVYKVKLIVPEKYIVGATGKKINEVKNNDGTITHVYYQEDIHDFAWTACPEFVEFREKYNLKNPEVNTEIILLIHKSHLNQKDRYLNSLKNAIEFFSKNYGPYPYPTITLVDPPPGAYGAGGMEYPTLFTSMSMWWIPEGIRLPEMVTIHEFGHNYWYGMVGSNEFEEAWLDEGINTYSEMKAMAKYYGKDKSMMDFHGIKLSDFSMNRIRLITNEDLDSILKNSWEYFSSSSYGANTYSKAGLMLITLENFLGGETMSKIMKTYFERWKFKHPTSKDFIKVAEEISGKDLKWFFLPLLFNPGKLDYSIKDLKSERVEKPKGFLNGNIKKEKDMFKNEIVVLRNGELIFPQEILIVFENGEKILQKWDGKDRWKRFVFYRPYKLKYAQIDPENKIVLDVNIFNNSKFLRPKKLISLKYALEAMFKFQTLLSFF